MELGGALAAVVVLAVLAGLSEVVVVVLLVVDVDCSGTHCPGFGVVTTGLEPSADAVLGGRAHSG